MPKKLPNLKHETLIFDGAMGTMLQKSGFLPPGAPPELLNLSHPEIVTEVHRVYIQAGSHCIQSNTFGANRIKLESEGLGDKVRELNFAGVQAAKSAAGDNAFVAASLGPTGKMMEPFGDISFNQVFEVFLEQSRIVAEAGVDFINIETMTDIMEIKAAVIAALTVNLPVVASVSFMDNGRTLMGFTPEMVAAILSGFPVWALGTNCGLSATAMKKIIPKLVSHTQRPLAVKPNAGKPFVNGTETFYQESPEEFAIACFELVNSGARIIGGCCGTTPEHIQCLYKILAKDTYKNENPSSYDYLVGKNLIIPLESFDDINCSWKIVLNEQNPIWQKFKLEDSEPLMDEIINLDSDEIQIITIDALALSSNDSQLLHELVRTVAMYWPNLISIIVDSSEHAKAVLTSYPGRLRITGDFNNIELVKTVSKYGGIFQKSR